MTRKYVAKLPIVFPTVYFEDLTETLIINLSQKSGLLVNVGDREKIAKPTFQNKVCLSKIVAVCGYRFSVSDHCPDPVSRPLAASIKLSLSSLFLFFPPSLPNCIRSFLALTCSLVKDRYRRCNRLAPLAPAISAPRIRGAQPASLRAHSSFLGWV